MTEEFELPVFSDDEKTAKVEQLLELVQNQRTEIESLREEVTRLKPPSENDIGQVVGRDVYNTLKSKRSFQHMPTKMFRRLVNAMRVHRFNPGDLILEQGEKNDHIYVILKGSVSVEIDGRILYNLNRVGDVIGEMSFITSSICSASVVAVTELNLLTISTDNLQKIGDTDFYIWLCRILTEKLSRTSRMVKN